MPLSEDEQRILKQIENQLSTSDPRLAQHVSETTLYRHSTRIITWAVVGFVAGLVLMVVTFTNILVLGVVGFSVMLGCSLVIAHHARAIGRAGLESLTDSMHDTPAKGMLTRATERWRQRPRPSQS